MVKKPSDTPAQTLDFETALRDLEAVVAQLESGDLALEASLEAFEKGITLTRHCQAALQAAELKVKQLTESDELIDLDIDPAE
ncbi:MAG: exodeoxyribonuclease VII small subunit [Xanthomonadales bacterium]|nr:exodeoxyribonuclease VII small subunit [Xanthomonadales bacterium]